MFTQRPFGTFFLSVFFFLVCIAVLSVPVRAEDKTQRWVCLLAEHCWKDPNSCSTAHKGNGHVAKLTEKPGYAPIPGVDTYIAVCISTGSDWLCTTGTAATDMTVYGKSNFDTLKASYGFAFEGLFKADGTTTVANPAVWSGPYEWGDSLPQSHAHQWQAMNYYDPTQFANGEGGGQQQGSFDFEASEKKCVSINWDPYGRVFDAGTLEPIRGATVTLFFKKGDSFVQMKASDILGGNLTNPQTTLEDGNFSFLVPDGDYKLTVTPLTAVTDAAQIDINYKKAYFDIYPSLTGDTIFQRGSIQHRDIPAVTVGTTATPKMMEYGTEADGNGGLNIRGRVSHPLSKLIAGTSKITEADPNTKIPYRTIGTYYADKWGRFDITIDQSKLEKVPEYTEIFTSLEVEKVDLRATAPQTRQNRGNILERLAQAIVDFIRPKITQAQAKSNIIRFEPIPQYLDGYAYDAYGKPIPNAKVGVYLTISNKPYTQTTADATGHFIFDSSVLPNYAYVIKYTTATGQVTQASPSKFLAQNNKYIVANKINPYVADDPNNEISQTKFAQANPNLVVGSGTSSSGTAGRNSSAAGKSSARSSTNYDRPSSAMPTTGATTQSQSSASPIIVIMLLIILLLGGVGAGVLLFMKNKQTVPPQW